MGFVFGLSCALNHHGGSMHSSNIESINILAQSDDSCCAINSASHDSFSSLLFLILPKNNTIDYGLLFFNDILFLVIPLLGLLKKTEQRLSHRIRLYKKRYLDISAFHYLRLAFSEGILNTKKYSSVSLG